MDTITFFHVVCATVSLLFGFLFIKRYEHLWGKNYVFIYIGIHFLTGLTGLFVGSFLKFTPLKILSLITIITISIAVYRRFLGNVKAFRYGMLFNYIGLCLAFVGSLDPYRQVGFRFWNFVSVDISVAYLIWQGLFAVSCVCVVYCTVRLVKEIRS